MEVYPDDGYSKETRTLYQFHGCVVHGHDCWLTRISKDTPKETSTISGKSMEQLRLNTEKMTQYLKDEGYLVIEMRECQWRNRKKHEKKMRKQLLMSSPILEVEETEDP